MVSAIVKLWSVVFTVRVKLEVCEMEAPLLALMLNAGCAPVAMPALVLIVKVEVIGLVPFGVTEFGLNAQVTPLSGAQLNVVGWLYPLTGVTVTVTGLVNACPATTVSELLLNPNVKSGAVTMTTAAVTVVDGFFKPSPL